MKHTLIILALLIGMICNAQEKLRYKNINSSSTEWFIKTENSFKPSKFIVKDSTRTVMEIRYEQDSAMTVYDSLATIKALVASINRLQDQVNIKYAAEDILQYIRLDGSITDKRKFAEAGTKYLKLKNKYKQ